MKSNDSLSWRCRILAAVLLAALAGAIAPAAAQTAAPPYVFFLVDTSGSMNFSPPCTQDQFDAGACGFLCPAGDCFVPLQGDDPASKFYQVKEALYTSIAQHDDFHLGFAGFNQDTFSVRAKHWMYQATGNGPRIAGTGPYFPAAGAQEVFGLTWACDTGSNDDEIGCYAAQPADLDDPWELARVQRLAKGGISFIQSVDVFIRYAGIVYKARYAPTPGLGVPGANLIYTNVTLYKCTNASCSTFTTVGTQTISWQRVSDFVSWDNSDVGSTKRTNPQLGYFSSGVATDATAMNTCAGWEPNNDTGADRSTTNGYSLHWPTDSSDPRGSLYSLGDVIPLDWQTDHKLDVERHLAPNLALDPAATPDFKVAAYLKDSRQGSETFLRLKSESAHPLIPFGSTPLGGSLVSFRYWFAAWRNTAAAQDPFWADRQFNVVLITDGDETCSGSPCSQAGALSALYGVKTFVVAFGMQPVPGDALACTAESGGTGAPYYPQTKQELIDDLALIYAAAATPLSPP